jgi:hypothetical protein
MVAPALTQSLNEDLRNGAIAVIGKDNGVATGEEVLQAHQHLG